MAEHKPIDFKLYYEELPKIKNKIKSKVFTKGAKNKSKYDIQPHSHPWMDYIRNSLYRLLIFSRKNH